jgi:hypothetical protein
MSHALSPVDAFDSITVPDDGEAAVATAPGVPASRVTLEEVVQNLANRDEWIRRSLQGTLKSPPSLRIREGASNIEIGALTELVLGEDRLSGTATTLALGTLPADVWRYVYAYNDGGALEYELSASAPEAGLVFKTGDTTRRYIGAFRSGVGGAVAPVHRVARETRQAFRVLTAGTDAAWTELILDDTLAGVDAIPPHASRALLRVTVAVQGRIRALGDTANEVTVDATANPLLWTIDARRNGGGRPVIEYQAVGGGASVTIDCLGWEE